jgi:hypothetical protein
MWKSRSFLLYLSLSVLALIALIGLDYTSWKKEEKSYFFPSPRPKKELILKDKPLSDTILQKVSELGVTTQAISQYRDNEGIYHIMIDLSLDQYKRLESLLGREFSTLKALTLKKEEKQVEEKKYFLWRVQHKEEPLLFLLFSCGLEKIAKKPTPAPPKARNKIALIVDDMGYSLDAIREICSLNKSLTVAILPFSPLGKETAHIAQQNHLQVILHLPLESLNNTYDNNNTQGIIHTGMSQEEIAQTIQLSLSQIPFIVGVNTHMGSKITSDREMMHAILAQLQGKELYFIDSRTTARSVAFDIAQEMSIPSGYRQVFLDSEINKDFIKSQLIELFQLAQTKGKAIGICHPSQETLDVLKENLHLAQEYDIEPVFVSEIIE